MKKKRKTNSGSGIASDSAVHASAALAFDSARSSSTSSAASGVAPSEAASSRSSAAAASAHSSSRSSAHAAGDIDEAIMIDEHLDVMGTPAALAPSTVLPMRLAFTPSAASGGGGAGGAEEDSTFRRLNFTTKDCATPGRYDARHKLGQPMQVFCRIKPLLQAELEATAAADGEAAVPAAVEKTLTIESDTSLLCSAPSTAHCYPSASRFKFTHIFGPEATQEDVYIAAGKPLVDSFYSGQNGLIFAYGITASGKTFTMQGTPENPGLIRRIVLQLFQKVLNSEAAAEAAAAAAAADGTEGFAMAGLGNQKLTVKASYLEVYNDEINDLLVDPAPVLEFGKNGRPTKASEKRVAAYKAGPRCRLQVGSGRDAEETTVVNLREVEINTHKEALALLEQGQSNRTARETLLNADSSRSHSVFTLKLMLPNGAVWSRLSVVDLAGSERTKRVVQSGDSGDHSRQRETANINQSLLTLGRCIDILRKNQSSRRGKQEVVPFRQSTITSLFKDSLSGWGRTVMMTNASQNPADFDETIAAMKYASSAVQIRIVPKVDSKRVARITHKRTASNSSATNSNRPSAGSKRGASAAMLTELEDVDGVASASAAAAASSSASGWDADDAAGNPSYDSLLEECVVLKQRVVELELSAARIEESVREELTSQQESLIEQMETSWSERLDAERTKAEERNKKLFAIWQQEFKQQYHEQMQQQASAINKENPLANQAPIAAGKATRKQK